MAGAALPSTPRPCHPQSGLVADPRHIQTSNVRPVVELPQTTPSVAGSTEGLSAMPLVTSAAGPPVPLPQSVALPQMAMTHAALLLTAMPLPAMQPPAMQPTAVPLTVTPFIMTARPNQLGLFAGAPSLNVQGTQFQGSYMHMPNPGWLIYSKGANVTRSAPT